jgi:ribose/xylose/arabinose/galactoside ABC-type transport system permease subunit
MTMGAAIGRKLLEYGIYIFLLALVVVYAALSPSFLTTRNLSGLFLNGNHLLITSIGMAFVILTGMVDLSVGSIAYVSMVVAGTLMRVYGIHPLAGLAVCLACGAALGLVNAVLIIRLGLNSMLVTMGMMIGLRGVGHQITHSLIIPMEDSLKGVIVKTVGGLPLMIILVLALTLCAQAVLSLTILGKHVIATGCNERAARNIGIRTDGVKMVVLVLSGTFAALAGFYTTINLGSCLQTMGTGWEFQAIAIAVLGGVSLSGGIGNVFPGVFVGFIIIVVAENGLALLGVNPYLLAIIRGAVIFVAMFADSMFSRTRSMVPA